jgi:hypothetical protein
MHNLQRVSRAPERLPWNLMDRLTLPYLHLQRTSKFVKLDHHGLAVNLLGVPQT